MRLIDADELQGEIYKRFTELRDCCLSMKQKISYDQERMIIANVIDNVPTVDPVKYLEENGYTVSEKRDRSKSKYCNECKANEEVCYVCEYYS